MKSNFLAGIAMLASISAVAAPVDITPARYHFHKGEFTEFKLANGTYTGNMAANQWATYSNEYDNGLVVFGGNFGSAVLPMRDAIRDNIKLVPMGIEIGYVLCLSDLNSNIGEELKTITGFDYGIQKIDQTGWRPYYHLNFYLDPTATPTEIRPGSVKVKITYNIYSPTPSAMKNAFISEFNVMEDGNTATVALKDMNKYDFTTDGSWDPSKWAVCEFVMPTPRAHNRLRFTTSGANANANEGCALLIRDITIEYDSEVPAPNAVTPTYNLVTLNPQNPEITTSVAEVTATQFGVEVNGGSVAANEDAVVYNVSGVKVAELRAGEQQQLAPGFYVATSASGSVKFAI